jgi:phosphoenolpyruvate carboxykinase (ATP)
MKIHNTEAWLVNTGWMGGTYNSGSRIDLRTTRRIINAILYDEMKNADFSTIPVFNLSVPAKIDGVEENILDPCLSWETPHRWHIAATDLAMKFIMNFSKFASNEETSRLAESGPRI